MNILLLNPPTHNRKAFIREGRCIQEQGVWTTLWPPITLATAGAMLEAAGHEVDILDCAAQGIYFEDLFAIIRKKTFDLIVWSSATPSIGSDLGLADEIKRIEPAIKTATLGTHVTALPEACLEQAKGLDFVIRNEPEESLVALADGLDKGISVKEIKGISFKDAEDRVFHNPRRPFIQDLDRLPFPAWGLLDLDKYRLPLIGKKFLIMAPIRGCPYPCTFCTAQSYYGKRVRRRSIPRMIDEIAYAMDRFGIDDFFIWADTFTVDRDYVLDFCHAILNEGLKIRWTCNSRVDTVDEDLLEAMARAGCWMISYGIEAGNQAILDRAGKKTTLQQACNAVKMAKGTGIKVTGHFVLGLPGESEQSLKETLNFALSLDMEWAQFYCAAPFPGSSLYETARGQGWIDGIGFSEFRQDNAVMRLPGLPPSLVNDYRKKAFRRFYLRPHRLIKTLHGTGIGGIGETIKGGIRFIRWAAL